MKYAELCHVYMCVLGQPSLLCAGVIERNAIDHPYSLLLLHACAHRVYGSNVVLASPSPTAPFSVAPTMPVRTDSCLPVPIGRNGRNYSTVGFEHPLPDGRAEKNEFSRVNALYPSYASRRSFQRQTGGSLGRDGSLLMTHDSVYVICRPMDMPMPIHVIENFHGWDKCRAWAQTVDATDYERRYDVCDYIMINAALGFTVNRVVLLQKLFRSAKKHKVGLALAGSAPNGRLPLEAQCCIAEFAWRSPNNKIPRTGQFRIKRWAIPGIESRDPAEQLRFRRAAAILSCAGATTHTMLHVGPV